MDERPLPEAELLRGIDGLVLRTRAALNARWFPLAVFGVVIAGGAPFFWGGLFSCIGTCGGHEPVLDVADALAPAVGRGSGVGLYWLIAVPLGFLSTVAYYRWRAWAVGRVGRVWPAILGGLAVFLYLVITSPQVLSLLHVHGEPMWVRLVLIGDTSHRGLAPLVAIAVAVIILGGMEHSRSLQVFGIVVLAVAITANLYDIENLLARLGWYVGGKASRLPNLLTPALLLLGGAIAFARADHRVNSQWKASRG